ncbi:facilitated trehalose transporter Tret1 isoform X2 [Anoplophora glabripennis]|uniref:facilitated trehalose transporter Tret1 isoform X2 n=1 Tax=Anoplophora glabripennis TaxID=217634 RepID=UPI000875747B|nr:facilitated trehalose transporter Tret1 isoform X2 [Anoplophora glabripennis]
MRFVGKLNHAILAVCAGDLLMLLSGSSFTWSSPVLPKLLNNTTSPFGRSISPDEATWISSLVPLGAAVGPFALAYMADKFGRKITLLFLGVPFLLSHLILAFGNIVELYYVARFTIGLSAGGTFTIMPNYAGEIADKSIRGALGSTISTATCAGLLLSYALGPYVSIMAFNLVLAMISVIFLVLFFFVGVECPQYFIIRKEYDLAEDALRKIRGGFKTGDVEKELAEIQMTIDEEHRGSIINVIKSTGFIKAFFMATGLLVFQQFTGINMVFYYTQIIFQETGSLWSPEICSIAIGVVQFLSSLTTPLIIDRLGRKFTLMGSAIWMILSEVPLGVYIYIKQRGIDVSSISFLPLLTLIVFIVAYNSGFGPLPWVMLGEVFPSRIKVIASSVVSCISWSLAFVLTKYFELFISFGLAESFWFFAGCCFLGLLFSKFCVVETKGKSLQEIQEIFNS